MLRSAAARAFRHSTLSGFSKADTWRTHPAYIQDCGNPTLRFHARYRVGYLAVLTILTAERLGLVPSLRCRCLDCGRPVELQVLCSKCGERRRIADRNKHHHHDACYEPEAEVRDLCADCRRVIFGRAANVTMLMNT